MAGTTLASASWYRFYGDAGRRMPTAPPGPERCGTQAAGWLATLHPPVGAAPRKGFVCFEDASSTCNATAEIEVCACSYDGGATATYSYKLPAPPVCDAAYCATDAGAQDMPLGLVGQPNDAAWPPEGGAGAAVDGTPPPPPPLPPDGWCHAECPQSLDPSEVTPLDAYWRSVHNVHSFVPGGYNRFEPACDRLDPLPPPRQPRHVARLPNGCTWSSGARGVARRRGLHLLARSGT